jgi:hypothetical protein
MLGKTIVNDFGLIDVNLDPCPYQILTSMGGSEKAQGLTKHEIVIQININKPTNYIIVWAQVVITHVRPMMCWLEVWCCTP